MGNEEDTGGDARFSIGDVLFVGLLFASVVLVPAMIVKIHFLGQSGQFQWSPGVVCGAFSFLVALVATALNFHLGVVRPWRHQKTNGSMDDFRFISGIPLIGSVAVFFAAILLPAGPVTGAILLLLFLLDLNGAPLAAFVVARELLSKETDEP